MTKSFSDLEGDADALTTDFFGLWADELPAEDVADCRKMGDCFISKFKLTRLGKLFKL